MNPKPYRRLTRNVAGAVSYSSLWLGDDHILIVSSTGYTESYSRVMLRDIKAVWVTRTNRRLYWGLAWAALTLFTGLRVTLVLLEGRVPSFSAVFVGLGLIGLAFNALLGQGCRVSLMTGVQTAALPALVRLRKARKVVSALESLIVAAQTDLAATLPRTEIPPEVPPPLETAPSPEATPPAAS